MNSHWIARVANNIFPLSIEKKDVKKALSEWIYEGNFYDTEATAETCQLCGQCDIRYQFEIWNQNTDNLLLIGSDCVTKFGGISVIGNKGQVLTGHAAKRKVAQDKHKLIEEAKTKSVINSLVALGSAALQAGDVFDMTDFTRYYQERGAFTPRQLTTVIWKLDKYKIDYNKSHFKLTIKRSREKQQLIDMEDWRVEKIYPCLSGTQKKLIQNKLKK